MSLPLCEIFVFRMLECFDTDLMAVSNNAFSRIAVGF